LKGWQLFSKDGDIVEKRATLLKRWRNCLIPYIFQFKITTKVLELLSILRFNYNTVAQRRSGEDKQIQVCQETKYRTTNEVQNKKTGTGICNS
jgi:hypothetical protein